MSEELTPVRLTQLASVQERLGHWDEAAGLYARAFRESLHSGAVEHASDALRGQARVRNRERRWDEAEELAELSREIAERAGLARAAARAVNVVGLIRHARGDWTGARALFAAPTSWRWTWATTSWPASRSRTPG
jgi:tetratricopeptide (TPR) repeat protein